ncbi:uncharacterized protein CTRU02_211242 [Colletotrichum truncatum]|uniref:Uncharacterized protein n=1 Tax=Colletotrichum truncatum TaxID=5467 RepID=A0ACC3YR78_COLTU|nr:uncharacterized protein CTRU02_02021 [Colletotrichum truncatum]KAF6799150.1 hypothetical protein CTRU02_02021 [Colletotrichum truncatum]
MSKELPRHERRSSSPMACGNGKPFDHCELTFKTLLGFLSTRVLRGGPRLVIQLILAFFALILLGKFFTSPSSDLLTSGSRWSWSPFGKSDEPVGNGRPGGVRLVAFGSPDIATPSNGKDKGWTEWLCEELSCSSHHTLIPQISLPTQALTSHRHYNATIDKVTRELDQEKAPGYNYDFILEQFPLAEAIADVTAQVDQFLAQPPPKDVPKETVWVFSFGTWDVWTLATLPRELGQGIIDLAVRELFVQIERVYQASLYTESAAFSDFWAYQNAELIQKLNKADKSGDAVDEREVENFRVIIPELFDISLTPGWHAQRQSPPSPHTKAEQMTNAAHLTDRWNSEIKGRMDEWMRTPDPEPKEGEEKGQFGYVPSKRRVASRRRRDAKDSEAPTVTAAIRVPFPRRVGAQVDSATFVREAIIERQMRQHRLTDSTGRGNRTEDGQVYYAEAWIPCIWAKTGETPEAPGDYSACEKPGDYLFHSPFTLGERAIQETARVAAAWTRSKLAFVDPVEEEQDGEEENKNEVQATAKVKRNEKRGAAMFQRVLRPNQALRIVDTACPTLDVC